MALGILIGVIVTTFLFFFLEREFCGHHETFPIMKMKCKKCGKIFNDPQVQRDHELDPCECSTRMRMYADDAINESNTQEQK